MWLKDLDTRDKRTLQLGLAASLLFIITHVASEFRFELFGIVPGYAPHNFTFNIVFITPARFVTLVLAFIALYRLGATYTNSSSNRQGRKTLFGSIVLALTLLINVILFLLNYKEWHNVFILNEIEGYHFGSEAMGPTYATATIYANSCLSYATLHFALVSLSWLAWRWRSKWFLIFASALTLLTLLNSSFDLIRIDIVGARIIEIFF